VLAVLLRGGVLSLCHRSLGLAPGLALVPAVAVAALINYLGSAFFVFAAPGRDTNRSWRVAAVGVAIYLLALRLAYLGEVELIPQEAYYWNYSQHLDLGYLDHPPMVAWLIWLGTLIFGKTAIGVRAGALAASLAAAVFVYLFTRNLLGRARAQIAVMLIACMPYFFGVGFLMTPDAPLVACWAGAVYFLERALRGGKGWGWIGAGACIGLGLLSKYTIALLPLSIPLYFLLDRPSRRWLRSPLPYAAALLAAALFSPVILWNARHGWASFEFQGPQRWTGAARFQLPLLIGHVLLLVTPLGIIGAIQGAWKAGKEGLFGLVFTAAPLFVFLVSSLHNETKLNWTGPVWIAALPFLAWSVLPPSGLVPGALARSIQQGWKITTLLLLLAAAGVLHYSVLGLPGAPPAIGYCGMSWSDLGRQVEDIEQEVQAEVGREPLIVGLDKYHLASELAFYDPEGDGARETAATNMFGRPGLMYALWFRPSEHRGQSVVLVSKKRRDLESPLVATRVARLEPTREILVQKNGAVVGTYFVRVAHGYCPGPR